MGKKLPKVISFSSLLILILIQVYIVNSYYNVKSDNYDNTYSLAILSTIESNEKSFIIDTLDVMLNKAAYYLLGEKLDTLNPSFREKILGIFDSLLIRYDMNRSGIIKYLTDNKLDTFFHAQYSIKEISLLNISGKIQLYKNDRTIDKKHIIKGLYIKSYYREGDFYLIKYDYYVDLTHKQKVILSEMKWLLIMITITLASVIFTFLYTLRTLKRQKKLSELKDDFINNITHEFKTPLSIISVAASSIKQDTIQSDIHKLSEIGSVLERQNKLLSKMIDNVIDVSILDGKNANINRESVNLKHFLTDTIASCMVNETYDKKIRVYEEYDLPEGYIYKLDVGQFSRVIINLLSNAIKYCDHDPVITVRAKLSNQLNIEIVDNGIGIQEEHLKTVFNKFFRVNTQNKAKGLGLGLYIVKRIVENHHGTIHLKSTWGNGTTVKISLPK